MISIIATLVVLAMLAFSTYSGLKQGAFFAVYTFMRSLIVFLVVMTFCEPLAQLGTALVSDKYPAYEYFVVISFAFLMGLTSAIIRKLKVSLTVPRIPMPRPVERACGGVFGLLNGAVISGMVLVLWTLMPFAKYIPGNGGHLHVGAHLLDTGHAVLVSYDSIQGKFGGNDDFLLDENEPMIEGKDENANGQPDGENDVFDDINGNGRWERVNRWITLDGFGRFDDINGNGRLDRGWLVRYRKHADIEPIDMYLASGKKALRPEVFPNAPRRRRTE